MRMKSRALAYKIPLYNSTWVTLEDIINSGSVERSVTSHGAYTTPLKLYSTYEVKLSL